jgi:hypothetical protein
MASAAGRAEIVYAIKLQPVDAVDDVIEANGWVVLGHDGKRVEAGHQQHHPSPSRKAFAQGSPWDAGTLS